MPMAVTPITACRRRPSSSSSSSYSSSPQQQQQQQQQPYRAASLLSPLAVVALVLLLLLAATVTVTSAQTSTGGGGGGGGGGEPWPPLPPDSTYAAFDGLEAAAAAAATTATTDSRAPAGRDDTIHSRYAHYSQYFNNNGDVSGGGGGVGAPPPPSSSSSSPYVSFITESDLAAATPSLCTARAGCPRSSMVWASGSLTAPQLLTPTTFLTETNATLQLSLCCDYKYDGRVLRNADLYDVFLAELLQASPFQVLTPLEKARLFPRERAFIVDITSKRVFSHASVLSERDVARHNDGDGDALVLVTGVLGRAEVTRVFVTAAGSPLYITNSNKDDKDEGKKRKTTAKLAADGSTTGNDDVADAASDGDISPFLSGRSSSGGGSSSTTAATNVLATDMQLKITNQVLKCKCPHTLLVMPLLRLRPDRLPPVAILGVGPHCGQKPSLLLSQQQKKGGMLSQRTPRVTPYRHIVRVMPPPQSSSSSSANGTTTAEALLLHPSQYQYATTFMASPPLPPGTKVTWTIRRLTPPPPPPSTTSSSLPTPGSASHAGPRTATATAALVLQHTAILPAAVTTTAATTAGGQVLLLSSAATPYVAVEPNAKYEVHLRAERVGGLLVSESRGVFVLRLPFHRHWPLPTLAPRPHFGFDRQLRLDAGLTLSHPEVAAALLPRGGVTTTVHASSASASAASDESVVRDSDRFDYYGYWDNAPDDTQALPQHYVHRAYNPFVAGYNPPFFYIINNQQQLVTGANNASDYYSSAQWSELMRDRLPPAPYPLFFGRNRLSYSLRDADGVCNVVQLESHEFWAVQGIVLTESPVTACGPSQEVEALPVRSLLHAMRELPQQQQKRRKGMAVNVPQTSWAAGLPLPEEGREGSFTCRTRTYISPSTAAAAAAALATKKDTKKKQHTATVTAASARYDGICDVTSTFNGGIGGTTAHLRLHRRGVYDTEWVVSVDVADASLLVADNMDPAFAAIHTNDGNTTDTKNTTINDNGGDDDSRVVVVVATVEVRSRVHHVVRRVAAFPRSIPVQLPMHARRFAVAPPRPLPDDPSPFSSSIPVNGIHNSKKGGSAAHGEGSDDLPPTGYWVTHSPLRTRSVDEKLRLELDTNAVPNVQQTLPNATLLFVATDLGEDLSTAYGLVYTSRCPDTFIEHVVSVVAMAAPPIVPAFVPIYTEDGCVVLEPPRMARKDEVVEWRVRECPEAGRPPHIVERIVVPLVANNSRASSSSPASQRAAATASTTIKQQVGSSHDNLVYASPTTTDDDATTDAAASTVAGRARPVVVVVLACGIEVYRRCEVEWTAASLVATVVRVYSLRRCQRPPEVVFHRDGLQRGTGLPDAIFALPSVSEAYYVRDSDNNDDDNYDGAEGDGTGVARTRVRRRSIIPIAGYAADVGYSFNYTAGPQKQFEATMTPLAGESANQLFVTQVHSPDDTHLHRYPFGGGSGGGGGIAVGPIIWRRRDRHELTPVATDADSNNINGGVASPSPSYHHDNDDGDSIGRSRGGGGGGDDIINNNGGLFGFRAHHDAAYYYPDGGLTRNGRDIHHDDDDDDGLMDAIVDSEDEDDGLYGDYLFDEHMTLLAMPVSPFWSSYQRYSGLTTSTIDNGDDTSTTAMMARTSRATPSLYFARWLTRRRLALLRRRNAAIDAALNAHFVLRHSVSRREVLFEGLANASLHPVDYTVRSSSLSTSGLPPTAALAEDRAEFQRRGMCVARRGHTALLAVSPLGAVAADSRTAPVLVVPAPAVALLPFCNRQFIFARHPHLHHVYGYDFSWECSPDTSSFSSSAPVFAVERRTPTYTTLTHVGESDVPYSPRASSAFHQQQNLRHLRNETTCKLTVRNDITETVKADWFLVRRVYPSPPHFDHYVIFSGNAASLPDKRQQQQHKYSESGKTAPRMPYSGSGDSQSPASSAAAAAPAIRKLYGRSVVLHVDGPSSPRHSYWEVISVVPAITGGQQQQHQQPVGTRVIAEAVRFTPLPRHPAALARGRGGSTVLTSGLDTPGLYTVAHVMPDPAYPSICPNITLSETVEVLHAQVRDRELFVCGATAALRAVPIPKDMAGEFIGVWEVLSLQTAEDELWTSGVNFTGISFEHGKRADTLVHGLPFGIVTIRWAVYKLIPAGNNQPQEFNQFHEHNSNSNGPSSTLRRVLVDHDTTRVIVLTENLHTHRLVTLADSADILTTSSTVDWHVVSEHYHGSEQQHKNSSVSSNSDAAYVKPLLRHNTLLNFSALSYFGGDSSSDGGGGEEDALLFPYYGPSPRPGTGVLTVSRLSVGSLHLGYTLRPSAGSLFGPMVGHTCELQGVFEVERVSAFLSARTTLDHECDGYTGEATITLCLHAKAVSHKKTTTTTAGTRSSSGTSTATRDSAAWESRLRLADPGTLEDIVKRGAHEVQSGGCAVPWWVWPSTRWRHAHYVSGNNNEGDEEEDAAAVEAGRCVRFTVTAGRHLSPREVSHPLFLATYSALSAGGPNANTINNQQQHRGRRASKAIGSGNVAATAAAQACGQGDFITSRIIDGSGGGSGGGLGFGSPTAGASAGGGGGGGGGGGLFSRFYRGSSDNSNGNRGLLRTYGIVRHLPVLHTDTLRRHSGHAMRPMLGLQGLPDEVTHETAVSRGNESIVTLRLDVTQPRQLGGYVAHTANATTSSTSTYQDGGDDDDGDDGDDNNDRRRRSGQRQQRRRKTTTATPLVAAAAARRSLLLSCVEGSVRAGDLLQYWTEVNRPDGAMDRTADEWVEYAQSVRDSPAPCEVLFTSLHDLLAKARRAAATATATTGRRPLAISGGVESDEDRSGGQHNQQRQQQQQLSSHQRLVPLEILEQQLRSIQSELQWTHDGIDVTGLRSDLQAALNQRRVTRQQLKEIEEARRARMEEEEQQRQQQQQKNQNQHRHLIPGIVNSSSSILVYTSAWERLLEVLRLYKSVAAAGGEEDREVVTAIRIRLPRSAPFVVPYDLFLRTALHKDVLCGTDITAGVDLASLFVAVPPPNRYSVVSMGRVEVVDQPAAVAPHPPAIKQCEVEGSMPALTLNVTGARFAVGAVGGSLSLNAASVLLEEIPNPDLPERFRVPPSARHHYYDSGEIGLRPCLSDMARGLEVSVGRATRKQLTLHLNACPQFRMLAMEEYNEDQDSEAVLQRLQFPRLLRVTVKGALAPDSFTDMRAGAAAVGSNNIINNNQGDTRNISIRVDSGGDVALAAAPRQQQQHRGGTLDVTFVIRVVPTLARLHLRNGGSGSGRAVPPPPPADAGLTPAAGGVLHAFRASAARPLLLCERDMRRGGFELGVELLGDHWTRPVGEARGDGSPRLASETYDDDDNNGNGGGGYMHSGGHRRERGASNVALINSFSIVEHYTLESAHHLFLKGAGVYRSHFVNYLFSSVLGDANVLQSHRFIRRYNSTFASIVIPPQPLSTVRSSSSNHNGGGSLSSSSSSLWLEAVDSETVDGMMEALVGRGSGFDSNSNSNSRNQHGGRWGQSSGSGSGSGGGGTASSPSHVSPVASSTAALQLPAVRRFSKIEEILFAVPGISTECRGCLLADTTFFAAGDLTGLWSFPLYYGGGGGSGSGSGGGGATSTAATPPSSSSSSRQAVTARRRAAAAAVGTELPTGIPSMTDGGSSGSRSGSSGGGTSPLVRPLVLPWHEAGAIPRSWRVHWVCPVAAHTALNAVHHLWDSIQATYSHDNNDHRRGPALALGDATLHVEVVLYAAARDTAGAERPSSQRPVTLLASDPVVLPRALQSFSGGGGGASRLISADLSDYTLRTSSSSGSGGGKGYALNFRVSEAAAEAAYTTVAADYLRHRRPTTGTTSSHQQQHHSLSASSASLFRYHRDDRYAHGLAAVNASVFLKLCVPLPEQQQPQQQRQDGGGAHTTATATATTATINRRQSCMVVSVTDTLITVEAPKPPPRRYGRAAGLLVSIGRALLSIPPTKDPSSTSTSNNINVNEGPWSWLFLSKGGGEGFTVVALANHMLMALLFYLVLPLLSVEAARRGSSHSSLTHEQEDDGIRRGGGRGGRTTGREADVTEYARQQQTFLTLAGLLSDSAHLGGNSRGGDADFADEAAVQERRAAFAVMFAILLSFAYAYAPTVWLALALALWSYVLYKARDGLVLLLFVGCAVYWRLFMMM